MYERVARIEAKLSIIGSISTAALALNAAMLSAVLALIIMLH